MKVIFAGGGTGGHINPALSIANYAKSKDEDFEALFIGTKRGLEKKLVPNAGYNIEYIDIEGFNRKNLLKNIKVLKKLSDAKKKCIKIINDFKPDCIICTGGYVSGPVAMASKKCNVPSLIHEQNVYPGLTVKGAEKYVEYVAVSFEETVNHMNNRDKCVVTGNPIRPEILAADKEISRKKMGISTKPFVLIFGGSLGADMINKTVVDMLPMVAKDNKFELLFGTGDRNFEKVSSMIKDKNLNLDKYPNIKVVPYIHNMHEVMAAADLVVSRSGAITVSEIAALEKPSILIPSPNVVRNHQEQNAREVESKGGAVVITENELCDSILYDKIIEIISDKDKMNAMSQSQRRLAKTDALEIIYDLMLKMSK